MKVKCIEAYYDLVLKRNVKAGEEYEVTEERAKELSGTNNKANRILVEVLSETETETVETETVETEVTTKKRGKAAAKKDVK